MAKFSVHVVSISIICLEEIWTSPDGEPRPLWDRVSIILNLPSVVFDQSSRHDHYHHVIGGDLMKRSMFSVHKVRVRHPDAIHYCIAKEHSLVEPVIKAFISPLLTKKDVQRKVLFEEVENSQPSKPQR